MTNFISTKALNEVEKKQAEEIIESLAYINSRIDVYNRVWFVKLFKDGTAVVNQRGENKSISHVFSAKNIEQVALFLKEKHYRFLGGYREIVGDISTVQLNAIQKSANSRIKSTVEKENLFKTHLQEFKEKQKRLKKFW